jgi:hypothetical protein
MDVCSSIASKTSYTIEQILDHPLAWVTELAESLAKQDFEDRIFQMALHGVNDKKLNEMRRDFYQQFDNTTVKKDTLMIPIDEFKGQGLSIGKKNSTKVVR